MKHRNSPLTNRRSKSWAEVDMQTKTELNAHYLMHFATAMSNQWRVLAMAYQ